MQREVFGTLLQHVDDKYGLVRLKSGEQRLFQLIVVLLLV